MLITIERNRSPVLFQCIVQRPQPFPSDRHRFEFLFALYEQLIAPLTAPPKGKKRKSTIE